LDKRSSSSTSQGRQLPKSAPIQRIMRSSDGCGTSTRRVLALDLTKWWVPRSGRGAPPPAGGASVDIIGCCNTRRTYITTYVFIIIHLHHGRWLVLNMGLAGSFFFPSSILNARRGVKSRLHDQRIMPHHCMHARSSAGGLDYFKD